jgi:tetratricopeptide (TPR) repeat protein
VAAATGDRRLSEPRYKAFISYSHRDERWATWLHKSLESYRPPKQLVGTKTSRGEVPRRLNPVFRDREELASATDLGEVISTALRESACQIIICSPNAARSKWVNEEILAFKRLGREDRIFCLIVAGEPNATDMPGREGEECFPPALRFHLAADGTLGDSRTEPIAADARPGKDGRPAAKLKLIAGMLGVGFDALRRREQQRRNRRLAIVAGAATFGMVLTSGLAAYALIQRSAAQRQTVRAEAEAETAKQTTKFLVDLFKISDPSEARGNTVTAREMLDKGAARVDRELAKQPAIQATLMDTLGTVYVGLGLYGQARPLLDRAVATRRRVAGTDPLVLSDSLSHLGDVLFQQADFDAAEKAYSEAIRIESARPDDRRSQEELATTLYGLGVLLAQEGHFKEAEKNLRDALGRQRALYGAAYPDIARTLKDLAKAVADGGDLNAAIPLAQSALAMQRELRGSEPHPDVAEAIGDLGWLLWRSGDYAGSEKFFREQLAMDRRLYGDKHREIANTLESLAQSSQDKGDLADAETLYREAIAMWRELLGDAHPDVALALHNLASLQYDRGETRDALATERESLAIYRKAFPEGHPMVAFVLNTIGLWLTVAGDYGEAGRDIHDALAMRRRLLGDRHPDVGSSLIHLAILDVAQGKYQEALESARTATDIYTTALSASHWKTAFGESAQGAALTGLGRYAEAEPLLTHGNAILGKAGNAPSLARALAQHYLDALHRRERVGSSAESPTSAARGMRGPATVTAAMQHRSDGK